MDEIDKLIAEVERLDREATPGPWLHYKRANTKPSEWPAWAISEVDDEEEQRIAAEGDPADIAFIVHCRTAAPVLAAEVRRLRAKFSPDAMDLVGQRLVNARKSLDPDAPIWLTLAMDEAWQALAFLRRNSAQQAARIEQQDEEIAKLHDTLTFADQQGAEAIERVSNAIVNDKWNATAAFQARALKAEKERDALHDRIEGALAAALGNPVMSIHDGDGPVADSLESLIALVASEHASVKRIRAEREEFRLSLLAEMGDPDGAPSDRWRCDGRNWYGDRGDGGMDKIEWYATPNGDGTVRHKRVWLDIDMHGFEKERGRFDLSRVAMQAADKALKVGSPS